MICGKLVINCRSMKTKHFSLTLPLSHTEQTHAWKFRNITRYSKWLNTMDWISLGWFLVTERSLAATFAGLHHSYNPSSIEQGRELRELVGRDGPVPWDRLKKWLNEEPELHPSDPEHLPLPQEWEKSPSFPWDKAENFPAAISWGDMC